MTLINRTDRDGVAYLELNMPQSLNALSDDMLAALGAALDELKSSETIKAVVLSGAGKAFCAGHDLKEMQAGRQSEDGGAAYFTDLFERCTEVMLKIRALPQPVIARVHSVAVAAGCQLVASCDLAVAAQSARFGVNGVNIGLFCSTPMVALSRALSRKAAFEMLVTGRLIEASEAKELGLINRVVPDEQLDTETEALAKTIAVKLPAAVKIGKDAFYKQLEMTMEDAYRYTGQVMTTNLMRSDTNEGITAFIEKRPPDWS